MATNQQDTGSKSSKPGDFRTILKFEGGVPTLVETDIPGINPLTRELKERSKKFPGRPPLLVIGDMAGLGKLNNKYGREVADRAVLYCLREFVDLFAGTGASAGSPSGDEMWAVAHPGATIKSITKNLKNYLRKIQTAKLSLEDCFLDFNARFLIGRDHQLFVDGEKYLKTPDGEKVLPGTISIYHCRGRIERITDCAKEWSVNRTGRAYLPLGGDLR